MRWTVCTSRTRVGRRGRGRLGALLQDLAHTHGKVQAAELLGVNYRTLARCLESGELTATMRQALEGYAGELPNDGELPDVVTTDGTQDENRGDDEVALLRQEVAALRAEVSRVTGEFDDRLARLERGAAGQSQPASAPPQPDTPRPRIHPQVVTVEPGQDDERVYRGAMPLIAEWRAIAGADGWGGAHA